MKLYPKDYVEAEPVAAEKITDPAVVDEVKAIVKSYVTAPKDYAQIVEHVEKERGSLSGIVDVIAIIDMVREEWHPVKAESVETPVEK